MHATTSLGQEVHFDQKESHLKKQKKTRYNMKPIVAQNKNKISNKICILHVWTHLLVILFLCLLKTFLLGDTHRKKGFGATLPAVAITTCGPVP